MGTYAIVYPYLVVRRNRWFFKIEDASIQLRDFLTHIKDTNFMEQQLHKSVFKGDISLAPIPLFKELVNYFNNL